MTTDQEMEKEKLSHPQPLQQQLVKHQQHQGCYLDALLQVTCPRHHINACLPKIQNHHEQIHFCHFKQVTMVGCPPVSFQVSTVVKNLPSNARDPRDGGLGKSPEIGSGNPLQCSCLRIHGQRSLAGYSPRGHRVGHN